MIRTESEVWEIVRKERKDGRRIEEGIEKRVEGIFYGIVEGWKEE